jgi:phosphoglycerate-specific signal transduction histidine kinase
MVLAGILAWGCSDSQRVGFELCEKLESQGDLEGALKACDGAAKKDRTTKYGELAEGRAYQIRRTLKSSLEAKAKDLDEQMQKWEADVKAGKIPPGTPPPGTPSKGPNGECNCKRGDPLCSCL